MKIFLILSLALIFCFSLSNSIEDDVMCLQGMKNSFSDPANKLSSWTFTNSFVTSICKHQGVVCWNEKKNRLISLQLLTMQLSGEVSRESEVLLEPPNPRSPTTPSPMQSFLKSVTGCHVSPRRSDHWYASLHPCEPNNESQASWSPRCYREEPYDVVSLLPCPNPCLPFHAQTFFEKLKEQKSFLGFEIWNWNWFWFWWESCGVKCSKEVECVILLFSLVYDFLSKQAENWFMILITTTFSFLGSFLGLWFLDFNFVFLYPGLCSCSRHT